MSSIEAVDRAVPEITREEILARIGDPSLVVLDVLPREAYGEGHIPGALNLPLAEVRERAPALLPDRSAEIAVYCASCT